MDRAYSIVQVKSIDESQRVIRGMATTPSPDRVGDIIDPLGAKYAPDIPLFLYHDSDQTVGRARLGKATRQGIPFEASIPLVKEEGNLKNRVDEAWQMLKYRLITAVSIGFNPLGDKIERLKDGGLRFLETEILELSLVPIPANAEATITSVKSLDRALLAASGKQSGHLPGVSGAVAQQGTTQRQKGTPMKTIQELREDRENKLARLKELTGAFADRESTNEEADEVDTLTVEVKRLGDDIRKKAVEDLNISRAVEVDGSSRSGAAASRGPTIIVRKTDQEDAFAGQSFTRMVIAQALASKLQGVSPGRVAEARWGKSNPTLVALIKANEVPGASENSSNWGHQLVVANNQYNGDFIQFLYGLTVFDRLPLKTIPANVLVKGQDGAATGFWVGESKAIPNTSMTFNGLTLTPLKVAAIAVASNELLADSSPAAEGLIRDGIANALAQRVDTTFLSATAASAGVSPAGLLNGVSAIPATGTDSAALRHDLKAALATFDAAKDTGNLQIVTTRALARSISLMFNALGTAQDFPGVTPTGGNLVSYPVTVGDNVPSGDIIILNPAEIYKIGDSGLQVSISQDAMIEQSTAPTGNTATPASASADFTSMFQEDSTAIKLVRRINFAKRRTSAVAVITGGDYGAASS